MALMLLVFNKATCSCFLDLCTPWDALPFCHLQIKVLRSPYPRLWKCKQPVPKEVKTLGDHIRLCRLERHILQSDLANALGVHRISIQNWERNIYHPTTEMIPKIQMWLGYELQQQDGC